MKLLIFLVFLMSTQISFSKTIAITHALEVNSIKVEYMETSNKGLVYVYGCKQCADKYYKFDSTVKITKDGQEILLEELMSDYWNANTPTLFLNSKNNVIEAISY